MNIVSAAYIVSGKADKDFDQIEGSQKLIAIWGFFPTLHDARVRSIGFDANSNEFTISFWYSDVSLINEKVEVARILTFTMKKPIEVFLCPPEGDVYSAGLKRLFSSGNLLFAWQDCGTGIPSYIECKAISVSATPVPEPGF